MRARNKGKGSASAGVVGQVRKGGRAIANISRPGGVNGVSRAGRAHGRPGTGSVARPGGNQSAHQR